ncbi:MAG: disulfide bond formation protein B [Pseudomonadota bacterium]
MTGVAQGRLLALVLSGGLLGGAYIAEYGFGLLPCEMCWWQRWPHFAALGLVALAFVAPGAKLWTALAGVAIIASGLIGGFHAGVEYDWWEGITACAVVDLSRDVLDPMASPLIPCGDPLWTLWGISLAGFNFLFSCLGGIAILAVILRPQPRAIL